MKFKRFARLVVRPHTPHRVAAAHRAVKRDAEEVPLFPELRRYASVEDRLIEVDERGLHFIRTFREFNAKMWRKARKQLQSFPPDKRAKIRAHWNKCIYPLSPEYLADIVTRIEQGQFSIEEYESDLEKVAETGRKWRLQKK